MEMRETSSKNQKKQKSHLLTTVTHFWVKPVPCSAKAWTLKHCKACFFQTRHFCRNIQLLYQNRGGGGGGTENNRKLCWPRHGDPAEVETGSYNGTAVLRHHKRGQLSPTHSFIYHQGSPLVLCSTAWLHQLCVEVMQTMEPVNQWVRVSQVFVCMWWLNNHVGKVQATHQHLAKKKKVHKIFRRKTTYRYFCYLIYK